MFLTRLNAEGMWYGGDDPISVAHLRERAATVMPAMKKPLPKEAAKPNVNSTRRRPVQCIHGFDQHNGAFFAD